MYPQKTFSIVIGKFFFMKSTQLLLNSQWVGTFFEEAMAFLNIQDFFEILIHKSFHDAFYIELKK